MKWVVLLIHCCWLVIKAEGANAAEEEGSEKSMSEVNDDEDGDEDGSGEVCLNVLWRLYYVYI